MVRGVPAALVVIPLEHREIGDPEEAEVAGLEGNRAGRQTSVPSARRKLSGGGVDQRACGTLRRLRSVRESGSCAPPTMTSRSSASASLDWRIFATASGKDFSSRLMSSKSLGPSALPKSGRRSSRSLRESSPTFGMRTATMGSSASSCKRLLLLGGESVADVGHRRQAKVGLVDAVQTDRLVVGHLRERRFEIRIRRVLNAALRKPSTTSKTVSCCGKVISRSICVNSG